MRTQIEMSKKQSLITIIVMVVIILLVSFWPASAQTQTPATQPTFAAVTLADVAMPSSVLFETATGCLEGAVRAGLSSKDAARFCIEARRLEADRAKTAAKAAAKAAQPQGCSFWAGGCSAAYGGGGIYSSGVSYGAPIIQQGGTRVTSCGEGGCNTVYSSGGVTYRVR